MSAFGHGGKLIRNLDELVRIPGRPELRSMRRTVLEVYGTALRSADPRSAVRRHLKTGKRRISVDGVELLLKDIESVRMIAFGKASSPMVEAVAEAVVLDEVLIVASGGKPPSMREFDFVEAGHPLPDEGSLRAGDLALKMAGRCGPKDLLLVLVSGGGSAMLEDTDLPLDDLREISDVLMKSGMDIVDLNTVRKHLSNIKGGQLGREAAARGATVVTLAISDVVGDPLSFIASGPTVPDETTFLDARRVLKDFGLWDTVPSAARDRIEAGVAGALEDTPGPGDPTFGRVHNVIVASNRVACRSAAEEARRRGYESIVLTSHLRGESKEVGRVLAAVAMAVDEESLRLSKPVAIVTGGETTVTVEGEGVGGRNQELALAAAPLLEGRNVVLLSCGTDGQDGPTEAAGAIVDGETMDRASRSGLDPADYLSRNDSHSFFRQLGDTVITGPTGTNVMDLQILLVRS